MFKLSHLYRNSKHSSNTVREEGSKSLIRGLLDLNRRLSVGGGVFEYLSICLGMPVVSSSGIATRNICLLVPNVNVTRMLQSWWQCLGHGACSIVCTQWTGIWRQQGAESSIIEWIPVGVYEPTGCESYRLKLQGNHQGMNMLHIATEYIRGGKTTLGNTYGDKEQGGNKKG